MIDRVLREGIALEKASRSASGMVSEHESRTIFSLGKSIRGFERAIPSQ